ncbi:hypothetical protein EDB87DRAFT_48605 [Lactarius vividus]|nr:hypothetical protein EDB87DRAFT_48605 [Lactarius vividus]
MKFARDVSTTAYLTKITFLPKGVWVMGYCRLMGYVHKIPAHRTRGRIRLWGIRGYGVSGVWDKRGSTVIPKLTSPYTLGVILPHTSVEILYSIREHFSFTSLVHVSHWESPTLRKL